MECNIYEPYGCTDLNEIAFKFLQSRGFSPRLVRANPGVLGFDTEGTTHDWIRLGHYNIDFGLAQFDITPFPVVIHIRSKDSKDLYGKRSVALDTRSYSEIRGTWFPPLEAIAQAKTEEDLEDLQGDYDGDVYLFRKVYATFFGS